LTASCGDKSVSGSSRASRRASSRHEDSAGPFAPAVLVAFVDCADLQQRADRPSVYRPEIRTLVSRQDLYPRWIGIRRVGRLFRDASEAGVL
jgi:hypothetical protein